MIPVLRRHPTRPWDRSTEANIGFILDNEKQTNSEVVKFFTLLREYNRYKQNFVKNIKFDLDRKNLSKFTYSLFNLVTLIFF